MLFLCWGKFRNWNPLPWEISYHRGKIRGHLPRFCNCIVFFSCFSECLLTQIQQFGAIAALVGRIQSRAVKSGIFRHVLVVAIRRLNFYLSVSLSWMCCLSIFHRIAAADFVQKRFLFTLTIEYDKT